MQKTEVVISRATVARILAMSFVLRSIRAVGRFIERVFTGDKTVSTLIVDYSRPVKDGIAVGRYDRVNKEITEANFPLQARESGKVEVDFKLFCFDRWINTDTALAKMKKKGFDPASLRELLVFGEANPELQRQFSISALFSLWKCPNPKNPVFGMYFSPELESVSRERRLGLTYFNALNPPSTRFLGVRRCKT